MHRRFVIATFAAALLLLGTPHGAMAASGGYRECRSEERCPGHDDYRAPDDGSEKWYDCRYDPYRDNDRYQTPCRYYSECTNYPRCKD
jgi:hypothetical protein